MQALSPNLIVLLNSCIKKWSAKKALYLKNWLESRYYQVKERKLDENQHVCCAHFAQFSRCNGSICLRLVYAKLNLVRWSITG